MCTVQHIEWTESSSTHSSMPDLMTDSSSTDSSSNIQSNSRPATPQPVTIEYICRYVNKEYMNERNSSTVGINNNQSVMMDKTQSMQHGISTRENDPDIAVVSNTEEIYTESQQSNEWRDEQTASNTICEFCCVLL